MDAILGLIAGTLCFAVGAVCAAWLNHRHAEALRRQRDGSARAVALQDEQHERALERLRASYERVIEAQAAAHQTAIEQMMNLANFGQSTRPAPIIEEREPDSVARGARRIDEETLTAAVAQLRMNYARVGHRVPDEELREEARSLLLGAQWTPPPSLAGLVRD